MFLSKKVSTLFSERFRDYTPIQKKAIPLILDGKDTLIIAPTGSGKTEAAILPLLDKMSANSALSSDSHLHPQPITLLYITPLRSLNRDMVERVRVWVHELGYKVSIRHGDTPQAERSFQSKHPAHIFITTPETLQIMLCTDTFRGYFKNLRYVVVDELHELIGSKRGAQLSLGLTRLRRIADFQTVALSATLANAKRAAEFVLKDDYVIARDSETRPPHIDVLKAEGKGESAKLDFMCNVVKENLTHSKTLIFTNTRYMAELISSRLIADGASIGVHHGSLSREERESVENAFKENKIRGLVCTSSLELGIDIGDVDLVIHISSPKQVRKSMQRIGRSGHAFGWASKGIIIAHNEFDFQEAQVISERTKKGLLEDDDIIYPCMDVLGHAVAGEVLVLKRTSDAELHGIFTKNKTYSSISLDDFRLLLSELHRYGIIFYDGMYVRGTARTREYYFTRVSTIPSSVKYPMEYKGRTISYLDERFVMSLNEGDVFITRGTPWQVLSIEAGKEGGAIGRAGYIGNKIVVERSANYVLAIPDWEGEQIPVKREIAHEVQKMMVHDEKPLIHSFADMLIIYTFLGNAANNALALAIANRLTNHFSAEVGVKSSPYAIFVKLPYPITRDAFVRVLKGTAVANEIKSTLNKNSTFSYNFSQSAYYMGMSDKHERYSPYYIAKLAPTLAYKEALDYFMYRYCDVRAAQAYLDGMLAHSIELITLNALPPIALEVLDHMSGSQVIFPDIPESAAMVLLDHAPRTYKFRCMNCGAEFYGNVEMLPKKCIKCGSVLLAPISDRDKIGKDEMMRRAALYNSYGKKAVIALATYGVGTDTAARILARLHPDDRSLALDLLRAREQFIRTKKYWSSEK